MQNWDRNLQDVKFKQKLNNIRSTLPKISSVGNASSSLITKKQQLDKSSSNLNNLESLYINVTNKMKQLTSSPVKPTNVTNPYPHPIQKKKNPEMKRQNYLKRLLNEFGLSQYLRKLYELGYDDNNINKIGLMSRKKFQELVLNMKMYPGQSIKMEKLYDYLKQYNIANTMYNTRLIGGKNNKLKNNNKKQINPEYNKRRLKTASGYNNLINNNKLNGNFTNYGSGYLNNKINNYSNLNTNNNINNERPKTTTNIKVKPIQKIPSSSYPNSNNKIKSKTIDSNINNYAILSPGYYLSSNNKSNNTNNKANSNNSLLNSFKKGDLGYGFYMNNNNINNNLIEDAKNQKQGPIINYFNEALISQNDCNNKLENINKYNTNINQNNEGELIEEKMTENIDNMLKYYMAQLNEKLDDSYGTVEDSSLSYNVSLPFNNDINKKNNKANGKLKLPSINNDKQTKLKKEEEIRNKNNEDIQTKQENKNENENEKKNEINTNKDNTKEKEQEKEKELINTNLDNKQLINEESTNINNNNEGKILSDQNNNESSKNMTNINLKAEQNKNDSSIEDINLDDFEQDEQDDQEKDKEKNIKQENINNNEVKDNNIEQNNNNNINNDINPQEKEKAGDIDENIELIEENKNEKENNNNQEIKYGFNGEKTGTNDQLNSAPQTQNQTQNERYSFEENIYDNLRLTKSLGGEYLHQNMDKFDIEYMCRCLSLAIMKLLESGKSKQHITDLMDKDNEKFEFFNNFFNSNYNIISDFFGKNQNNGDNNINNNIDNKMSNLEKLELQNNKLISDNIDINLLKHLKKDIDDKLIKEQEIKNKQYKLKNNLADIEKDIKFIDEFFSMNRQRTKNYKGLSEKTKNIMCKELSYINEVDSEINNTKTNSMISNNLEKNNISKQSVKEEEKKEVEAEDNYENEFDDAEIDNKKNEQNNENEININNDINKKFSSISDINNKDSVKLNEKKEMENINNNDNINTNLKIDEVIKTNNEQIKEELPQINNANNANINKDSIESGSMESDYVIDINTMDKFKTYLLKQAEVFDDDFIYSAMHIPTRKYVPPPDPQVIFEFCANIMILTKMEKEVIIITLLYLERFIFNTGLLLTSRNWRRIIFITMAIASKIWDDDSFENNHFAQVFKHLSIGEINLLERTFLDMINYKVYVKCSEYFKYFFIIKSIALKYNYNGVEMIPISVERMMKIQEYAYQMQKRVRKKINLSNSTNF